MPIYTYKCPITGKSKEITLSMGHHDDGDIPTYSEIMDEEECKKIGVSPDDELQRVYTPINHSWGGVRKSTTRPTDSTSATKEKNEKLKKLYNDSYVGMDNYDKTPYEERKKKEADES